MNNWRETTPEPARGDIHALVRVALEVAREHLSTHGVLPQAVVAADDAGHFETEIALPATSGPSSSLTGRLVRSPHRFRAMAVVNTGRSGDNDRVDIHVEHVDGVALDISARYRVIGLCGGVDFAEFASRDAEPELWARALVDV